MKRFYIIMIVGVIICIIPASCILQIPKEIKAMLSADHDVYAGNEYYIGWEGKGLIYGDPINGGPVVIHEGIIDYAYDDMWIIAKTKIPYGYHKSIPDSVSSDSITDYWIIDKSIKLDLHKEETYGHIYQIGSPFANLTNEEGWMRLGVITKNVTGPLDSVSFYKLLKEKAITLNFKQRKH